MRVKILGCSGGIGGNLRTTSMLVDEDILIDAGTGVGDLSMEELIKIDHILITHSHLDHIAFIPLLIDTVMGFREEPITVHASISLCLYLSGPGMSTTHAPSAPVAIVKPSSRL